MMQGAESDFNCADKTIAGTRVAPGSGAIGREVGAVAAAGGPPSTMGRRRFRGVAFPAAVLALGGGIAAAQTCDGLVAHWAFNGDATDSSGSGNNGQLFGGSFSPGVAGEAFQMGDASFGPYAEFPNSPSLNPANAITVSAWWLATSFQGNGGNPIVDKAYINHSGPYYQYHLSVVGNQYANHPTSFEFAVGLNLQYVYALSNGNVWQTGRWYHVAGTYDGSEVRLYANGTLLASRSATGQLVDYGSPVRVARFGSLNAGLPGAVDEVRIYNRALSAIEIAYLAAHPDGKPIAQPASQMTCSGSTVSISVSSMAVGPLTYLWRRDGVPVDIGVNPSAATATLTLTNIGPADVASYDCIVTSACGGTTSNPATLTITTGCNLADIVGIGGGTLPNGNACPDGLLTGDDFNAFIAAFAAGEPLADITGIGGPPSTPDGLVTGDDFNAFIAAFANGCP